MGYILTSLAAVLLKRLHFSHTVMRKIAWKRNQPFKRMEKHRWISLNHPVFALWHVCFDRAIKEPKGGTRIIASEASATVASIRRNWRWCVICIRAPDFANPSDVQYMHVYAPPDPDKLRSRGDEICSPERPGDTDRGGKRVLFRGGRGRDLSLSGPTMEEGAPENGVCCVETAEGQ